MLARPVYNVTIQNQLLIILPDLHCEIKIITPLIYMALKKEIFKMYMQYFKEHTDLTLNIKISNSFASVRFKL